MTLMQPIALPERGLPWGGATGVVPESAAQPGNGVRRLVAAAQVEAP